MDTEIFQGTISRTEIVNYPKVSSCEWFNEMLEANETVEVFTHEFQTVLEKSGLDVVWSWLFSKDRKRSTKCSHTPYENEYSKNQLISDFTLTTGRAYLEWSSKTRLAQIQNKFMITNTVF